MTMTNKERDVLKGKIVEEIFGLMNVRLSLLRQNKEVGHVSWGRVFRVGTVLTSECTSLTPPANFEERKKSAFNCKQTNQNLLLTNSLSLAPS